MLGGAGPRAQGWADETRWRGCRHGERARHRAWERQTDTQTCSGPERQPFLTPLLLTRAWLPPSLPTQAALAPPGPHPVGSHLVTHSALTTAHTASDRTACPPPRGSDLVTLRSAPHEDSALSHRLLCPPHRPRGPRSPPHAPHRPVRATQPAPAPTQIELAASAQLRTKQARSALAGTTGMFA